eukprot:gene8338-11279_t
MSSTSSTNNSNHKKAVDVLISMGYDEERANIALLRCNNDINRAADLLATSKDVKDDAEFDLIAAAKPEPKIRTPTVFKPHVPGSAAENFTGTAAELEDSRITSLVEMGFTASQAEEALVQSNGDVNAALSLLLSQS